jgi:hypothetical protein
LAFIENGDEKIKILPIETVIKRKTKHYLAKIAKYLLLT